ncbi:MAG: four helix bundle protein [Gemmatimonadota bacterium]
MSEEAMKLVVLVDVITLRLERRRHYLADQIRRAVLSVLLNIGEAAAEFNSGEKARLFGLARRSAEEVAIGLAVAVRLHLLTDEEIAESIGQADRVNGMLTGLIVYHRNSVLQKKGAVRKPSRPAPKPPR